MNETFVKDLKQFIGSLWPTLYLDLSKAFDSVLYNRFILQVYFLVKSLGSVPETPYGLMRLFSYTYIER